MTLVQDVSVTELYDAQPPAITAATEPRMKIVARLDVARYKDKITLHQHYYYH